MSHKIIAFLLEVNRKPAFVLFLQIGNTGDVEQDFTEVVLVNRRQTHISGMSETGRYLNRQSNHSLFSFSTETSAVPPALSTTRCIC